jgi:hypothetical protein
VGAAYALLIGIALARAHYRSRLFASDGFGYYIYLPSLFIDGDLDLWNQLVLHPGQRVHDFYDVVPETGISGNGFQFGCALLWAPFFLLTHLALSLLGALGVDVPRDGFGLAYELPVYCGGFAYGLLGLWYMRRLLDDLWGQAVANTATAYTALATALAAYLWFEPDLSHLTSMTLITMYFYYLHCAYRTDDLRVVSWVRIGLLLGLIAAVRVPDALVGVVAVGVGMSVLGDAPLGGPGRRLAVFLKCTLTCGAAAWLAFLPQMLVWKVLFDHYLLIPNNSNYDRTEWLHPDIVNYFFFSGRGLFVWTPLAIAAVLGLLLAGRRGPAIVRYALLVFALAVYFNSSIFHWWVGCSFCDRRLVDFAVVLALGLGYLLSLRPQWVFRWQLHAVGAALIAFNWLLMLRYFARQLPESGPLDWGDLYLNTLRFPVQMLQRFLH